MAPPQHATGSVPARGCTHLECRPSGFSTVELMVAVAITGVLAFGLVDILVASKQVFVREEAFARTQEVGRYALGLITKALRGTRTLGCDSLGAAQSRDRLVVRACLLLRSPGACDPSAMLGGHLLDTDRAFGHEGSMGQAPTLDDLPADARANVAQRWLRGDVVSVWGVTGSGALVTNDAESETDRDGAIMADSIGLQTGGFALITDCEQSEVFAVSGLHGGVEHATTDSHGEVVNASGAFSRAYNWRGTSQTPGSLYRARLYPLIYRVYYVCCADGRDGSLQSGATRVGNCRADPGRYRPSLCVYDVAQGQSQTLVSNIADLRATYSGARADGRFEGLRADQITDWSGVAGVRIELLAVSGEELETTPSLPSSVDWPPSPGRVVADTLGADLRSADRRQYQRFATTVALRARTPRTATTR